MVATCKKKLVDLAREIYLIISSNDVWNKWKEVLEKHETEILANPDTGMVFNKIVSFKHIKPLVM